MATVATFLMMTENGTQKYVFDVPGIYQVGRGGDCTLTIDSDMDSSISRNHCQILVSDNGVYIRDTGSSNGTFINNQRLSDGSSRSESPRTETLDSVVTSGDILKVGNTTFQVDVKIENPEELELSLEKTEITTIPDANPEIEPIDSKTPHLTPAPVTKNPVAESEPAVAPSPISTVQPVVISQPLTDEKEAPVIVNGWTILPQKKKNKNLIILNNANF